VRILRLELRVAAAGVHPLPADHALAPQAKAHSQQSYFQSLASIVPLRIDNGLFICDIVCRAHNIAEDLLRRGLATVHPAARRAGSPLLQIEADACRAGAGFFAGDRAPPFVVGTAEAVKVTQMWEEKRFTVQIMAQMPAIDRALSGPLQPLVGPPAEKASVVVQAGGSAFRSRVQEVREGKRIAKLMDYGDVVQVPLERVGEAPPEIAGIDSQAVMVDLAFVRPAGAARDADVEEIWALVKEKRLYMFVVACDQPPRVLLTDAPQIHAASLNIALVRMGVAHYVRSDAPPMFEPAIAQFE
jgi:hypothetical protein